MPSLTTKIIVHNLLLAFAAILGFLLGTSDVVSAYLLQIIALLALIYVVFNFLARKLFPSLKPYGVILNISQLTLVVFLLVFSTGALLSPVFFLLYFLLFAVSLLVEPVSALVLSAVSVILFVFFPMQEVLTEILQLVSLLLITPLALLIGKQYITTVRNETKVKVLEAEGKILSQEIDQQEKEVKTWTYSDLASRLTDIQKGITSLLVSPALSRKEKDELRILFKKAYDIFESSRNMEKKIEG